MRLRMSNRLQIPVLTIQHGKHKKDATPVTVKKIDECVVEDENEIKNEQSLTNFELLGESSSSSRKAFFETSVDYQDSSVLQGLGQNMGFQLPEAQMLFDYNIMELTMCNRE